MIEVVSFDPMQGAIFYILDEHPSDHPVFQRAELDCTQAMQLKQEFTSTIERLLAEKDGKPVSQVR